MTFLHKDLLHTKIYYLDLKQSKLLIFFLVAIISEYINVLILTFLTRKGNVTFLSTNFSLKLRK